MADQTDLLRSQCRMYALVAEIEAMKAENAKWAADGNGPCYSQSDFMDVAQRLEELARGL